MTAARRPEPSYVPVGLAGADGFPWSRLVMGLIAVVLSATTTWRAGRPPVEPAVDESPRAAQRNAGDLPLPLQQPAAVPAGALPAPTVEVARAPAPPPDLSFELPARQRRVAHVTAPAAGHMRRTKARAPAVVVAKQLARVKLTTRAALRNEYIASREEVAALTGEDSGSAYLSRRAAHQLAATQMTPAHGRRRDSATNRS